MEQEGSSTALVLCDGRGSRRVDGGAVAVFWGRGPESREQEASGLAWGVGAGASEGKSKLLPCQGKSLVWARKAARGPKNLGVTKLRDLLAYWQRLKARLGILSPQSRAQLLCLQARPGLVPSRRRWKQASLDASCRLPGSPDGLWRREDGKKLESVCGGRVYPDQKLG